MVDTNSRQATNGRSNTLMLGYLDWHVTATARGKQIPAYVRNIVQTR